jgi:maltoporin
MAAAYVRSFRNANDSLDFGDVDEGLVMMRPSVFFVDWAGLAVEGSFQALQRGVLTDLEQPAGAVASAEPSPLTARVGRVGVLPFLTPRGRGSFSRPMIHLTYLATFRDAGARALYPVDDVYGIREIDHFFGVGAEWWFGSTSYGGLTW